MISTRDRGLHVETIYQGFLKQHQRQRTDSTHALAAVRQLNRLEMLGKAMWAVLNRLSVAAPDWVT